MFKVILNSSLLLFRFSTRGVAQRAKRDGNQEKLICYIDMRREKEK